MARPEINITVDLNAGTGIGALGAFQISGTTISADSGSGDINLESAAGGAVTLSSISTDSGNIQFDQTGTATLTITSAVTTTSGSITITNDEADLTATSVSAAGGSAVVLTTTSAGTTGDVLLDADGANRHRQRQDIVDDQERRGGDLRCGDRTDHRHVDQGAAEAGEPADEPADNSRQQGGDQCGIERQQLSRHPSSSSYS